MSEQLRDLLSRRADAKREIERLQAQIGVLDMDIATALDDEDTLTCDGWRIIMTRPSVRRTFAPERLRELSKALRGTGSGQIADLIDGCQSESPVAGGLRITRLK